MTEKHAIGLQLLSGRAVLCAARNPYITRRHAYRTSTGSEWTEGKEMKTLLSYDNYEWLLTKTSEEAQAHSEKLANTKIFAM